jgi:membrane associated rhomboid family serine protease
MLGLYFMGPETERAIGTRQFFILYFLSGILGGIGWLFISDSPWAVCIGASGAIFGVIGAFAALFPHRPITLLVLFILPVTMKAWVLAVSLAVVELVFLLGSPQQGIAYAAHLAGGVAGYVYALALFRGLGGVMRSWRSWTRENPVSQVELDRILDKIAREGIQSLSRRERTVLDEASRDAKRQRTPDN